MGLGKSLEERRLAGLQMEQPEGGSRREAWGTQDTGRSGWLEENRPQTGGHETPCQVPVSLNVDQMPRLLVTLQREGGENRREETLGGAAGWCFCVVGKESQGALQFAMDLFGIQD